MVDAVVRFQNIGVENERGRKDAQPLDMLLDEIAKDKNSVKTLVTASEGKLELADLVQIGPKSSVSQGPRLEEAFSKRHGLDAPGRCIV